MNTRILFILLALYFPTVYSIFSLSSEEFLQKIQPIISDFQIWQKERQEFVRYSQGYPMGWPEFNCFVPEAFEAPSDIHHVAPWHITVIGAMGDSLSAGRSALATSFKDISKDYRGASFIMGEDYHLHDYATLPSIFRHFSPNIVGSSHNVSTDADVALSHFNVARSGALAYDLLRQAQELVKRMKLELSTKFYSEWKFINMFIGSNDLCKVCTNETKHGPETFFKSYRETILYLKENLPRAYINIMPAFNVSALITTHANNPFCVDFHKVACPCLFDMDLDALEKVKAEMDNSLKEFTKEPYQTDDFSVVIAPIIAKIVDLPIVGSTVNIAFTALDCFHFSPMAHDMVAKLLWNSLFEGTSKREMISNFDVFNPRSYECPPQPCPYLKTAVNSVNCTENILRFPSNPRFQLFDIELPTVIDLEGRSSTDTGFLNFSFYLIGFMIMFTVVIVVANTIQKRVTKKNKRKAYEGTPLLLTANLYDDLF